MSHALEVMQDVLLLVRHSLVGVEVAHRLPDSDEVGCEQRCSVIAGLAVPGQRK
jgi:hypothetical protein